MCLNFERCYFFACCLQWGLETFKGKKVSSKTSPLKPVAKESNVYKVDLCVDMPPAQISILTSKERLHSYVYSEPIKGVLI